MKYIQLLFIFVFIIASCLFLAVDNSNAQSMDFGIFGGTNISSHIKNFQYSSGDVDIDLDPKITMSFQAGFIARKKITQSFRLQAEPSLIILGARYEEPFTLRGFELQTESKTELIYVQLPILFQLSTFQPQENVFGRKKARTTYHLSGGFFGGYLLDARFSGTNTGAPIGISFEGDFSNDVSAQYAEYDSGLLLGLGLEHGHPSTNSIGFETRAQYSVIDSGNDNTNLNFKPQNMAITFSVYYLF